MSFFLYCLCIRQENVHLVATKEDSEFFERSSEVLTVSSEIWCSFDGFYYSVLVFDILISRRSSSSFKKWKGLCNMLLFCISFISLENKTDPCLKHVCNKRMNFFLKVHFCLVKQIPRSLGHIVVSIRASNVLWIQNPCYGF